MTEPCAMQNHNASLLVQTDETKKSEDAISKQNLLSDTELETLRIQGSKDASPLLFSDAGSLITPYEQRATEYLTTSFGSESSSTRKSFVAEMQANLNQSSTGVCTGMDDFFKQQMADKKGMSARKGEAAENLRSCRTRFSPQTSVRINTKDAVIPVDGAAANRAAAAMYVANVRQLNVAYACLVAEERKEEPIATSKSTKVWNRPTEDKPAVVRSMSEFYQIQKAGRVSDETRKAAAMKEYHEYNGKVLVLGTSTETYLPVESSPRNIDPPAQVKKVDNTSAIAPHIVVNFKGSDYRGFVFVVHLDHGLMLLFCARKKKKGPHHQLAGGHVDEHEFLEAAKSSSDCHTQLLLAAQMGAARELFEETGMDLREHLHRLEPAALRSEDTIKEKGDIVLTCELKKRLYFFLHVTNDDFPIGVQGKHGFTHPMTTPGNELLLKLSSEHQGFCFERDPIKAAEMLKNHSGGNGSKALMMAMSRNKLQSKEETSDLLVVKQGDSHREIEPVSQFTMEKSKSSSAPELVQLLSEECGDVPMDLLARPEAKNIFSCCFWRDNCHGKATTTK